MNKRRVVLLSEQDLFGESLEYILNNLEDVEVLGLWAIDNQLLARLSEQAPDLLVIIEKEPPGELISHLTAQILETHPNLPIIRVTLARNELRIFTSKTVPARSADLIALIRSLPVLTNGNNKT